MKLNQNSRVIECPDVSPLAWDEDDLVEPMTGRRIALDGRPLPRRAFLVGYPFDRGLCFRGLDAFWTLAYDNRGTKAVLYKNWKEHRELNRSYYFAKAFDYPIALTSINNGRVVIVHCPNSYDTVEIEDAETGEVLGKKKSDEMEFHSRFSVSTDGRFLLSAGWFWHPLGGAWLCPVSAICGSDGAHLKEVGFSYGAEIDDAAFLGDDHIVVSSTSGVVNEEAPPSGLGPLQLGIWSIAESRWVSTAPLQEATGSIMPWKEWVISFHGHPKAIDLATGNVVHVWDQINSGRQIGSIELGEPPPPVMALNPRKGMFAVCDSKGIAVVSLHASE
ncbi:MAG: hypothetical protein ACLPZY_11730 [Terracidiphilus sp.]